MLKMTGTSNGWTQLEYVQQPDVGGSLPTWLIHRQMGSTLAWVTTIQQHFVSLRRLEEWDAKDGEAVGEVLVMKTDAEKHHGKGETKVEARVRAMMKTQQGLRELGEKHEWFEALLVKALTNKLFAKIRSVRFVSSKLCNLSVTQAEMIGGALAMNIAANLTAPAAVDEWILQNPAMQELEHE
jgi:hypothetical protein